MSQRRVNETSLTATADALRAKLGTSDPIPWVENEGFKEAVEALPEEGGGTGELQELDVTPSHEAQEFIPAEGVAGYKKVTVKPVPRVRMVETSVESDGGTVAKVTMDMQMDTDGTSRTYPQYYLYNGVRLPEFPFGVIGQYPYAWIRNNTTSGYYELIMADAPFYYLYNGSSSAGFTLVDQAKTQPKYRVSISGASSATAWELENNASNTWWGIYADRPCLWSNHDIPNGSADATDIYFEGTEPVLTE